MRDPSLTGRTPTLEGSSDENPADLLLGEFSCDESRMPAAAHHPRDWLYASTAGRSSLSWHYQLVRGGADPGGSAPEAGARAGAPAVPGDLHPPDRQWQGAYPAAPVVSSPIMPATSTASSSLLHWISPCISSSRASYRASSVRLILQRFGVEFVDRFNAQRGASSVRRIARKSKKGHSLVFFRKVRLSASPGCNRFAWAPSSPPLAATRRSAAGNRGRPDCSRRPLVPALAVSKSPYARRQPEGSSWQDALKLRMPHAGRSAPGAANPT